MIPRRYFLRHNKLRKNSSKVPRHIKKEECLKRTKKLQNSPLEVVPCAPALFRAPRDVPFAGCMLPCSTALFY